MGAYNLTERKEKKCKNVVFIRIENLVRGFVHMGSAGLEGGKGGMRECAMKRGVW